MNVYEELRSVLDSHPTTAPESPKILEILEILFTPDEASLAAKMSYKPWPIEKIAKTGADHGSRGGKASRINGQQGDPLL